MSRRNGRERAGRAGQLADLSARFEDRTAVIGVVGLGYVGLPLAVEMARAGYRVVGFDVSGRVVAGVNRGESHVGDVSSE
ncbi:MAG TPA: NAD(P)-binding domain-containing protein, partial [Longimicrobiales bacterium]